MVEAPIAKASVLEALIALFFRGGSVGERVAGDLMACEFARH